MGNIQERPIYGIYSGDVFMRHIHYTGEVYMGYIHERPIYGIYSGEAYMGYIQEMSI